jgi:hypothetical protein
MIGGAESTQACLFFPRSGDGFGSSGIRARGAKSLEEEAIRSGLGAYFITAHDLAADLGGRIGKAGWIAGCACTWRRKFW